MYFITYQYIPLITYCQGISASNSDDELIKVMEPLLSKKWGKHDFMFKEDFLKLPEMVALKRIIERASAEARIALLRDFQLGKGSDPEHLATLMQEEICRLTDQLVEIDRKR